MADIAQTFALNPYAAEAQKLERQRKYAEILQAQGLQPEGKHSYAGIEAPPSAAGALAKGLQLGMSGFMQGRADKKYDDLIGRAKSERTEDLGKFFDALKGTEAIPSGPADDPMGIGEQTPPQAAVPGSTAAGYQALLSARDPSLQSMGMKGVIDESVLERNRKLAEALFSEPAGATPNAVPGAAPVAGMAPSMDPQGAPPMGAPQAPQAPQGTSAVPITPQQKKILQGMVAAGDTQATIGKVYADMLKANQSNATQIRGQDLTVETAAASLQQADRHFNTLSADQQMKARQADVEYFDKTGKHLLSEENQAAPPAGPITPTPTGAKRPLIETVPPVEARKYLAEQPQADISVKTVGQGITLRNNNIDQLLNSPGFDSILGPINSLTPNLRADAANAQALFDTVKNQASVQALNDMRSASKTGGAVGAVSQGEWPILQSQYVALQQAQSPAQLRRALEDLKDTYNRIYKTQKDSYKSIYGKDAPVSLLPKDQEALDWAAANPNDPRAEAIKKKLGM